jgi:DNA-binding response OmpR family regulator
MASPFKVLIAENDPALARFIAQVVSRVEGIPFVVHSGRVALEVLGDNPDIQLLITDAILPQLDGVELVGTIRASRQLDTLAIIVVAAEAILTDTQRLLEKSVVQCLPQPLSAAELRDHVRLALRRAAIGSQSADERISGSFSVVSPPVSGSFQRGGDFSAEEVPTRPDVLTRNS